MTAQLGVLHNLHYILLSVFLNAVAQLFMKKGMLKVGVVDVTALLARWETLIFNGFIWGSLACYALSLALWFVVLSRVEVSAAYPFLGLGFVLVSVFGYYFFNESMTLARVAGMGLICVGLILVSRS